MPNIPIGQARQRFTMMLADFMVQNVRPNTFLQSFFTEKMNPARYVNIDYLRFAETVADDVVRGTEGNRNDFGKNTNKTFDPPLYKEYFDVTQLDGYDRAIGSTAMNAGMTDPGAYAYLIQGANMRIEALQNKISRAINNSIVQALSTGTIKYKAAGDFDTLRRSDSFIDAGTGFYWDDDGTDPYAQLEADCKWVRGYGKATSNHFNVVLGDKALRILLNNSVVRGRNDLKMWKLDDINTPQVNGTGGMYHGTISAGSYVCHLWTFVDPYDTLDASGNPVPTTILPSNLVYVMPTQPRWLLTYSQCPQIMLQYATTGTPIANSGLVPRDVNGKFVVSDYIDPKLSAHLVQVMSAPLPILVGKDQVRTRTVCTPDE